jgi:hypothetical protein
MPSSRFLISSQTLTSTAASVTFSSIPSGYTDLVLRVSARMSVAGPDNINVQINSFTNSHSYTDVYGSGSTATSTRATGVGFFRLQNILIGTEATANTFCSAECYFPSYTNGANKVMSHFGVGEDNIANPVYAVATAGLLSQTATISSLTITPAGGNFVSGSSFYLYGIKNS